MKHNLRLKVQKKLNMQENHTLINLKENIWQSKLGIRKNGNVPKTPWTLHDVFMIFTSTWNFELPKTELNWVGYDQNKKAKNKNSKKVIAVRFIAKFTSNNAHQTTSKHFTSKPSQIIISRTFGRLIRLRDEGDMRSLSLKGVAKFFAFYSRFFSIFSEN